MEFTFTLAEIEFNEAVKLHISKSLDRRIGIIMLLLGSILLFFNNTNLNDINSIISTSIALILLILFSYIFGKVLRSILIKKLYRKSTIINKELSISIFDDGLTMKHHVGHSFITWNGIYKWVNNKDFYLLYTAPNAFYIIPNRAINDTEEEKLLQYLTVNSSNSSSC